MCRLLGVSKSGYYGWRDRPPSKRTLGDEVLTEKIRLVHTQSRGIYGYRRITTELVEEHDERVGRHKVARLMHAAGIQGVTRRKFCRTTRRDDRARPAPDLLGRDFTAKRPNARWVADITYVPTWAGFLFLAVVLDVFTRKVVGWSMSATQNTELVTRALQMAVARGRPDGVVVHHSDQGLSRWIQEAVATPRHWRWQMATMRERQREVQLYRGQITSPGRPSVAWRQDRVQVLGGDRSRPKD